MIPRSEPPFFLLAFALALLAGCVSQPSEGEPALGPSAAEARIARARRVVREAESAAAAGDLSGAIGTVLRGYVSDSDTEKLLREVIEAGASDFEVESFWQPTSVDVDGRPLFVEGVATVIASGRPRLD